MAALGRHSSGRDPVPGYRAAGGAVSRFPQLRPCPLLPAPRGRIPTKGCGNSAGSGAGFGSRRQRSGRRGAVTELVQVLQFVSAGGLVALALGGTYWGGRISQGMQQLQAMMQDHEERLRTGGL